MPLLKGHDVPLTHLYTVTWMSGVFSVLWSFFMGVWILRHSKDLFDSEQWLLFVEAIQGQKFIVGVVILIGGVVGVLGLALDKRWLSLIACVIGIGWCGWLAAYLWFAPANVGAGFAVLGCSVFIFRFVLLLITPAGRDRVGQRR
jgi:hypothetical protein